MTEELQDYDQELEKLCAEIEKGIANLAKEKDRATKISYLQGRLTRAKQVFRSFKVEMRDLSKAEAEPFQRKAKEHNDRINKLINDLNWAQEKDDLMKGGSAAQDPDTMTTQQVLEKGAKTQDESIKSLDRTIATIEQTKHLGSETAQALAEQTEQLGRISEGVDEVESNLKQADKQLRAFVRKIATDKIIMGFMCLIVCAIVAIIVIKVVDTSATSGSPDNV